MSNIEEIQKVENLIEKNELQARKRALDFERQQLILNKKQEEFNKTIAITGTIISIIFVFNFLREAFGIDFNSIPELFQFGIFIGIGIFLTFALGFLKKHLT